MTRARKPAPRPRRTQYGRPAGRPFFLYDAGRRSAVCGSCQRYVPVARVRGGYRLACGRCGGVLLCGLKAYDRAVARAVAGHQPAALAAEAEEAPEGAPPVGRQEEMP